MPSGRDSIRGNDVEIFPLASDQKYAVPFNEVLNVGQITLITCCIVSLSLSVTHNLQCSVAESRNCMSG